MTGLSQVGCSSPKPQKNMTQLLSGAERYFSWWANRSSCAHSRQKRLQTLPIKKSHVPVLPREKMQNTYDIPQLCLFAFSTTVCCLLTLVPEKIMQNTHISKVIALFVSTTVWQSGGDAPYCKTAIAACWALPKLPSGRWAARFPLVSLLPLAPLLHHHLALCLSLCLSLCVSSSPYCSRYLFFVSTSRFPCIVPVPHLYLPAHPPPSRPGSHTETRGSVKIERGMKERERERERETDRKMRTTACQLCLMICSILFSFPPITVGFMWLSVSPLILSLMYTLQCKELLGNAYSKDMCMDAHTHTHSAHRHTGGSPPSSSLSGCSIWTVVFNQWLCGQRG